ncbi:MAG: hypothetical protein M3Z85_04550 [Acidobacteriota bacterium]|nr:hypothetical protein [Acidobacteriota bacterium]
MARITRRLLDAVLEKVPKVLTRADLEMLVFASIDRLGYEEWDAVCERYKAHPQHFRINSYRNSETFII